jgi:surface polysaccharide O-acyltransferase-like enzyme
LGVPFLLSIFVLMPIAYYPTFLRYHLPGTTDFNFFHFWWHTLTIGPWPSGPAWFLWVLLALDAIAALLWAIAPGAIEALGRAIFSMRDRAMTAFVAFMIFSIAIYLPLRLVFGDGAWLEPGGYPVPIQTSRILLYPGYFFFGVGVGALNLRSGLFAESGEVARRWPVWLAFAVLFYGAILVLVYAHHNWVADFNAPPLIWRAGYGLAFALFSAAMTFLEPALFLRFAAGNWRVLDALRPSTYGIFLVHYIFIIWLQYAVYGLAWHAGVKAAVVFAGTLSLSWALVMLLRKIPLVARMI